LGATLAAKPAMQHENTDDEHQQQRPSMPTTRLIVKNLPKYATDAMVRKHFSRFALTDLRLMRTSDGKFRRFAYLGFATPRDARACQKHFDNTYFDTSRICVDEALPFGDSCLPRAWSRYSHDSSAYRLTALNAHKAHKQSEAVAAQREKERKLAEVVKKRNFVQALLGDAVDEAELGMFLQAMQPKSKTKAWGNDEGCVSDIGGRKAAVKVQVKSVRSKKAGGDGVFLPKVHMKFEGTAAEEVESAYFAPSDDEHLYDQFPGAGPAGEHAAVEEEREIGRPEAEPVPFARAVGKYRELSPDAIAESGRLFVRNLPFTCVEADLMALFSKYGPVSEVHIPLVRDTKQAKGIAYILFAIPTDAVKAYASLDGTIFQGRLLHILPSEDARDKKHIDQPSTASNSYQAKKQAELKARASSSHNWNSLFIRADTVLDAVAARLGVAKSAIMNAHESDSLATRMAVAETHVIQETKEYLEEAGVCLDAFGPGEKERSKTIILVKNLSFASEEAELKTMFARFGTIERFILPPLTKAIALVEFVEAVEAKTAFRALAYTNYRAAPLFLEWAPIKALKAKEKMAASTVSSAAAAVDVVYEKEMLLNAGTRNEDKAAMSSSTTLYIKNLSFSTTEDDLRALFEGRLMDCRLRSVRIPRKADPKQRSQQPLSLGFGFVEFDGEEWVNRAIDELQGVLLDGHQLVLRRAEGLISGATKKEPKVSASASASASAALDAPSTSESTKLLLKNIPFETSASELRALIVSFTAGLKRLRLPKKMDGQLRGFAFAEFVSVAEAKRVKEVLAGTHFYGRHLVIEWSNASSL